MARIDYNNEFTDWEDTGIIWANITKASGQGISAWPAIYAIAQAIQERVDIVKEVNADGWPWLPYSTFETYGYEDKVSNGKYRRVYSAIESIRNNVMGLVGAYLDPDKADALSDIYSSFSDIGDYGLFDMIWDIEDIKTITTIGAEDHIFVADLSVNTPIKPYWFRQLHDVLNLLTIPYVGVGFSGSSTSTTPGEDVFIKVLTADSEEAALADFRPLANAWVTGVCDAYFNSATALVREVNTNMTMYQPADLEGDSWRCKATFYKQGAASEQFTVYGSNLDSYDLTHGDYTMPTAVKFVHVKKIWGEVLYLTPLVPDNNKWNFVSQPAWATIENITGVPTAHAAQPAYVAGPFHNAPNIDYSNAILIDPRGIVTDFKFKL